MNRPDLLTPADRVKLARDWKRLHRRRALQQYALGGFAALALTVGLSAIVGTLYHLATL